MKRAACAALLLLAAAAAAARPAAAPAPHAQRAAGVHALLHSDLGCGSAANSQWCACCRLARLRSARAAAC
jgi:hypothetical protein